MKTFPFHRFNENFMHENVLIPCFSLACEMTCEILIRVYIDARKATDSILVRRSPFIIILTAFSLLLPTINSDRLIFDTCKYI